jgi:hypothetical protein
MKTVELIKTTSEVANLLDQARQDDLVVRLADGSEFLLIALVDEFEQALARSRDNPRLIALLESRAAQMETVSLEEVKRRLQL